MGEGRELMQALQQQLEAIAKHYRDGDDTAGNVILAASTISILTAVSNTLATQPDPVPELPPYVTTFFADNVFRIEFANGEAEFIDADCDPDDLDRISEAARILAARERARRAGS